MNIRPLEIKSQRNAEGEGTGGRESLFIDYLKSDKLKEVNNEMMKMQTPNFNSQPRV
jgi:hypothetical protein